MVPLMIGAKSSISFESSYCNTAMPPQRQGGIGSWVYTGLDIPEPGNENARINLWLFGGKAPQNRQEAEVIVSQFQFVDAATHAEGPQRTE